MNVNDVIVLFNWAKLDAAAYVIDGKIKAGAFRADSEIWGWLNDSKEIESLLEELKDDPWETLEGYTAKFGVYDAIFACQKEGALRLVYYEDTGYRTWYRIPKFEEYLRDTPETVEALLRNGEYVMTQLAGGRGLSKVNSSYLFSAKQNGDGGPVLN